jgi:hypothetical protein
MLKVMMAPGSAARAEIVPWPGVVTAAYCLRLFLDPEMVVIHIPEGPDGRRELASFLRSVSREAGLLATVLAPDSGTYGPSGQQEPGLKEWFSESGAGGFDPRWPE